MHSQLQATLRGLGVSSPPALPSLMASLNRLMHNPPMVLRGAEVLRLKEGGPAVGLFGPAKYEHSSVTLQPGDTLVLFTDGVSEAMNVAMEEFGEERLIEVIRRGKALKTMDLIEEVFKACDRFAAGAPQHDDMTLLIVRAG